MKVALCLRGIHWLQSYQDKKNNNFYQIDWRKNIKNIRLTIIKPFKKKGIEIDIYISTNQSELQEEYYNSFNPRPKYFNAYDIETNGKIYLPVKRRTLELLREVKKSNEKYEYIIVSRPDLSLKTEILNIPFNPDCINFTCKATFDKNSGCDFLQICNSDTLQDLLNAYKKVYKKIGSTHHLHLVCNAFAILGDDRKNIFNNELVQLVKSHVVNTSV